MRKEAFVHGGIICLAILLANRPAAQSAPGTQAPASQGSTRTPERPQFLTATIYSASRDNPKVLFKFKQEAHRSGSTLQVQREFTYPDGKPAAREHVVYAGDALVSFELEELQTGAHGRATLHRSPNHPGHGSIAFEYTPAAGGRAQKHTESLAENTIVNDMVGLFLGAHWEALRQGNKVKCRYIVVPRGETVGFTFVKDSEAKWQGRDVLIVRMEASSRFVATVVHPLFFTLEQAPPHRVLQYTGRTTPKVQDQGKWKDLDAVTVFDWDSAR